MIKMPCPPPLHITEEESNGVAHVEGSKPREVCGQAIHMAGRGVAGSDLAALGSDPAALRSKVPGSAFGDKVMVGFVREILLALQAGERMAASYVNFYLPNGGVVVPQFGGKAADTDAR